MQADTLGTGLQQTIVAMITSDVTRAGHGSRVAIELHASAAVGTGLLTDSVIMTDNLATVLDSEIDRSIGSLPDMPAVDAALRHTLAL